MEGHESYTRLLGLALRGGNLVMGSDAVQGAAHAGTARLILLSADASVRTCKDAALWSERGNCLLVALPCDKDELGAALGRGSVAVAALTNAGLAAAVGERLALYDSARYGAVAERLRLKSKRAAERARARPDGAKSRREREALHGGTPPQKRERRPDDAPRKRESAPDAAPRKRASRPNGAPKRASRRDATSAPKRERRPDGAAPQKRAKRPDGTSGRASRHDGTPPPKREARHGVTSPRKRANKPNGAAPSRNPGRPQARPRRKSD